MEELKNISRDVSIKVRRVDYDETRQLTPNLPITFVDLFGAMVELWKNSPAKARDRAIGRIAQRRDTSTAPTA